MEENTNTDPTFDELLKNPDYQREFDKKLEGARQKWEAKWIEESAKKQEEAERLAKMNESERRQHELKQLTEEKEQALAQLNAYRLKDEAVKMAKEKGVDARLLDLFDYSKETAESISSKMEVLMASVNGVVESQVNERLKQAPPQQRNETPSNKDFKRASF